MNLSQKCQYGLRAVFELGKRSGQGPTRVSEIAEVQAIPPRFLELILNELRHGGFVESRRGVQGGYMLAVAPIAVAVGDIIRFIDGPLAPVKCLAAPGTGECPLEGHCSFIGLWERAAAAVAEVYDSTTLQDLIDQERSVTRVLDYCI